MARRKVVSGALYALHASGLSVRSREPHEYCLCWVIMDAEAFLGAQLWLRRLPAEAWPTPTRAAPATATTTGGGKKSHNACRHVLTAEDGLDAPSTGLNTGHVPGGSRAILEHARCCFLLENRPSAAARNDRGSSRAPEEAAGAAADSTTMENAAVDGRSGGSSSGIDATSRRCRRRRPRPLYFSTSNAATCANHDKKSSRNGRRSPRPDEAAAAAATEQQPGIASNLARGSEKGPNVCHAGGSHENRGTARIAGSYQSGGCLTAAAAAPVGEPSPVSLRHEFDFGVAIARGSTTTPPPSGEQPEPDGAGGGRHLQAEEGGGALLLRIEGKVYEAEHTLIRSIAYPRAGLDGSGGNRGEGVGSGDARGEAPPNQAPPVGTAMAAVKPVAVRNDDNLVDPNRGGGGGDDDDDGGDSGKQRGPLPASGEVSAVPPTRPPPVESTAAGPKVSGGKRSIEEYVPDGAAGVSDTRQDGGGGKRCCFHGAGGYAGKTEAAAAAAAAVAEGQARETSRGGEELETGMPFCGLFFPGVLLKFWLPRRHGEARTEAVARLQGVVNAMLAGLSSTPRCERPMDSGGKASQELDGLVNSAVAEGQANGFHQRYEAWDEFAYGSHFFLRQERCRRDKGDRRPRGASDQSQCCGGHSNSDAEGPALWPSGSRRSAWMGIDAPALSGLLAKGDSDALLGSGVLSDVGRARALTSLAECFSRASLPSPVRLAVQRRLRAAATSASQELECALDQAFPLNLSQETDSNTRVSMVSELEASLRRVQQTRESLLSISILPASDVLEEWDSGSRV